jgi:hypothetical protein
MRRKAIILALGSALVAASEALACAVCWGGGSESSMLDGTKVSILFMAALTYTVLGGFIVGFVVIARRAKAAHGATTHLKKER